MTLRSFDSLIPIHTRCTQSSLCSPVPTCIMITSAIASTIAIITVVPVIVTIISIASTSPVVVAIPPWRTTATPWPVPRTARTTPCASPVSMVPVVISVPWRASTAIIIPIPIVPPMTVITPPTTSVPSTVPISSTTTPPFIPIPPPLRNVFDRNNRLIKLSPIRRLLGLGRIIHIRKLHKCVILLHINSNEFTVGTKEHFKVFPLGRFF
mmetsp:Transcript_14172/g.20774  ORF Transcript_14172/g.20774 Transcript_14172/m.20774 type:complete len:210 (+) Transcript_14172:510-1139(+)